MRSVRYFAVFLVLFILLSPLAYAPEEHLLPLQGTAKLNTVRMEGGNLIIEIYDAPSGGNLVYNSTNDFLNVISGGAYDILLGNGTQPLSLNYGTKYYMDLYINGVDVDFNSSERQVFMSTVGNLTVTTPIRTSSNDADDALNISNGGSFFSGNVSVNGTFNVTANNGTVRTAGAVAILDSDRDSALNISVGGAFVGGDMVFNNFFNVTTTASAVRTNGTVTILSKLSQALLVQGFNISGADSSLRTNGTVIINNTDADDALNVSNGGGNFRGQLGVQNYTSATIPAFTVNYGFNVSGANSAVSTNGTVTMGSTAVIQSTDADDALNVSNGGGNFRGQLGVQNYTSATIPAFTVNYGFNVSGANSALSTNGTVTMGSTAVIQSTDADDALNVSNGGGNFRGQLGVQNYTSATIPAFTVNYGFNVSGANSAVSTNGTVTVLSTASPAFSLNGFNISGANSALNTNGTVTISNNNPDVAALNITPGNLFMSGGGEFVMNRFFNLTSATSEVRTNGTITILSTLSQALLVQGFNVSGADSSLRTNGTVIINNTDADDALNVSNGGGNFRGQLGVQNYTSATIPAFTVNYGFNVSGANAALSTNGTVTIAGITTLTNTDADDALNVSNGGGNFRGQLGVQNYTSVTIPVFTLNSGFNVSGANGVLVTNSTIAIQTFSESRANAFTVNRGFNISGANNDVRTNATITILSADADDALNVTSGSINIGEDASTAQHRLTIWDGGTDKCSQLVLYDETGADYFIYVNSTQGRLMISNSSPTTCSEGVVVGGQSETS